MTGEYYLGWTDGAGLHRHNPAGMAELTAIGMAAAIMRGRGQPHTVLSADELKTWKVREAMEAAELASGEVMTHSSGSKIAARLVPDRIKLEDQTVNLLLERALAMQADMRVFKTAAYADVEAFMEVLREKYRANRAGRRGGVELSSYNGLRQVKISIADTMTFGPELKVAKELLDEYVAALTAGSVAELQVLVNDAFRVGRDGGLPTDRILGLRRLEITDERWLQAMRAIDDALKVQSSRSYIRFYQRADVDAKWEQVSLQMSEL